MAVDRLGARRQIAMAATVGLALRLAFALLYWVDKPLTHDEQEYLALADSLAQGRGFSYSQPASGTTAQFGRAPGYPVFLAMIGAGSANATSAPASVKIAQSLVGALTIGLIAFRGYASGRASCGRRRGMAGVHLPAARLDLVVRVL